MDLRTLFYKQRKDILGSEDILSNPHNFKGLSYNLSLRLKLKLNYY